MWIRDRDGSARQESAQESTSGRCVRKDPRLQDRKHKFEGGWGVATARQVNNHVGRLRRSEKFAKMLPYVVRREADIIVDAVVVQDSANAITDGRQGNAAVSE